MPLIKSLSLRVLISLFLLSMAPLVASIHAQEASQESVIAVNDIAEDARNKLNQAQGRLEGLYGTVEDSKTDDGRLADAKIKVDALVQELLQVSVSLRPRFDQIKARLAELGEPPKDGQPPEAVEVAEERNKLTAERLAINTLTGDAENLSISATQLSNTISQIRRDLFADRLLERKEISGALLQDALDAAHTEVADFKRTVGSWLAFIWKFKRAALGSAVMLSLFVALVLLVAEYRLFGSFIKRDPTIEAPAYVSRLSVAFWSTIIPSLALGVFLASTYIFLDVFNVLRQDTAPIVLAFLAFVGLIFFVTMLARALLAPRAPNWRLVPLSNRGAGYIAAAVVLMAVINGFDYVLSTVSEALGSPVVVTVMKSLLSSAIVGLLVFLISFLKPVISADGDPTAPGRPLPRGIASLLRLVGLGVVFAGFIGYVGLARFLATQLVLTGAVIATMYIGILSGREISAPNRFGETRVGRWVARRFDLNEVGVDQAGMVAGLLIYIFALMVGVPLILISWGFQPRDLQIWAFQVFTEIQIGSIRISLIGIVGGILLFALGLYGTRWFQKWLDGGVLARSQVDAGVRNSVRTGVGYLGTALAGLIGISAAGIDLSSFALVAGALSLGIGFGLQNIVSNFVSGLILLAERPFKVGDWVATGTTEGFVRRISVRATEIETFQRQSIIVPNSQLINNSVGNWTHRNNLGRVDLEVRVSQENDPRHVINVLQELASVQAGVLRNPEPFVIFSGFGPSSLDFKLCLYIPDVMNSRVVKNETRIAIFERFKTEAIELAKT